MSDRLFELLVDTMTGRGVSLHERDVERTEVVIDALDGESLPAPVRFVFPRRNSRPSSLCSALI
ncbi:hypothetical protein EXU48_02035 [Occultella glacieicola]|uniref:Uncharacterized protein n=1 Tax=Occultella glacieicola TaxID=2518684 RepID=A0ABY2E909_9MICO|nr:hypothetical protein [Occultella glacieicola]TDE98989.1 hypothetical protein EXU48_02035 [Occultella glacieicola]